MDLTKFKDSIGKQLFSIFGWIGFTVFLHLYLWMNNPKGSLYNNPGAGFVFAWYFWGVLGLIGFSLIFYVIELVIGYKIKNKFFLENKIYNIFWILGALFSLLFILALILGILYAIYIIIFFQYF